MKTTDMLNDCREQSALGIMHANEGSFSTSQYHLGEYGRILREIRERLISGVDSMAVRLHAAKMIDDLENV